MLKITITATPAERRWVVQERLVGPWVSELRTVLKTTRRGRDKRIGANRAKLFFRSMARTEEQ